MSQIRKWEEREHFLITLFRPNLLLREICDVLRRLGYPRSLDSVGSRITRAGLIFQRLGEPDTSSLSPQEQTALREVLEARGRALAAPPPPPQEIEPRLWAPPVPVPRLVVQTTIRDLQEKLRAISQELPPSPLPLQARQEKGSNSLVLLISDLHLGAETSNYNLQIGMDRLAGIPQKLPALLPKPTEVIVCLLGDIVDGEEIYPTQQSNLGVTLLDQVMAGTEALWKLILSFRATGAIVRVFTVPGNHGRMSKTANEQTNWDNVVYMQLGILAQMTGDPNLQIVKNFGEFFLAEVRGKVLLLNHKGAKHTGTPAMRIRLAGWGNRWPFDIFLQGHHHRWSVGTLFGRPIVSNGSLIGIDSLTERIGECDPPRQGYFLIGEDNSFQGFSYLEW